jgi:hypothetical protein
MSHCHFSLVHHWVPGHHTTLSDATVGLLHAALAARYPLVVGVINVEHDAYARDRIELLEGVFHSSQLQ